MGTRSSHQWRMGICKQQERGSPSRLGSPLRSCQPSIHSCRACASLRAETPPTGLLKRTVTPHRPAARVLTGLRDARRPAGVQPAPIGGRGPPGGQQGTRATVCPGWALHAVIPLPYSLPAPMADTAEMTGRCAACAQRAATPSSSLRPGRALGFGLEPRTTLDGQRRRSDSDDTAWRQLGPRLMTRTPLRDAGSGGARGATQQPCGGPGPRRSGPLAQATRRRARRPVHPTRI